MIFFTTSIIEVVDTYTNILHLDIPLEPVVDLLNDYRLENCRSLTEQDAQQIYAEICDRRIAIHDHIVAKMQEQKLKRNDI